MFILLKEQVLFYRNTYFLQRDGTRFRCSNANDIVMRMFSMMEFVSQFHWIAETGVNSELQGYRITPDVK